VPAVVLRRAAGDRKRCKIAPLCFEQEEAKCRFATSVEINGGHVRQIVWSNEWCGQRKRACKMGVKFPIRDRMVNLNKLSVNTRASHAALVHGLVRKEDLAIGARKHEKSPTPPVAEEKEATTS
jgi:hypothetical protein